MVTEEDVYKIGIITKLHGVRGEVVFSFTDDVWDRVETEYLFVRVEGLLVPFFLEEYRFRNDTTALLKFQRIDTPEAAHELCGGEVFFPHSLRPEDEEEKYTWNCLCGFTIMDVEKGEIGVIDNVDDSTQNVLFAVGTLLIPAADDLIENINHEARTITMRLPEGLTEI